MSVRAARRRSAVFATLVVVVFGLLFPTTSFARPILGQLTQAPADLPRLRAQAGARNLRAGDHHDAAKLALTSQRPTAGEHAAEDEGVGEVDAAKRRREGAPLSPLHDPDGRRISRTVSSTTNNVTTFPDEEYFAWSGANVVARLDKTGAVRQGFLFEGVDKPLRLRDTASNLKYFYELDIAGNVRRLRRVDGSDAGGYRYAGFGGELSSNVAPAVDQPLRWKARWWSDFAKLYDVRARQWSPDLGSFTSVDDFAFQDPTGTLWSWPNQDPVELTDPTGHSRGPQDQADDATTTNPVQDFAHSAIGEFLGFGKVARGTARRSNAILMLSHEGTADAAIGEYMAGVCEMSEGLGEVVDNAGIAIAGIDLVAGMGKAAAVGGADAIRTRGGRMPATPQKGPYIHGITKGGLSDIVRSQQLIATDARVVAGGSSAVRAYTTSLDSLGAHPSTDFIEFTTARVPTETNVGQQSVAWWMESGERLDINISRIAHPDGSVTIFSIE